MFILLLIWSKEDGHTDVSHIPHVSPGTLQTLAIQEVVGRDHWCQLHELLCTCMCVYEAVLNISACTCTGIGHVHFMYMHTGA